MESAKSTISHFTLPTQMLYTFAFLGGILTIFSPCVLPVLPFIFSQTTTSFKRSGLPLLVGMGLSFSVVAAFATIGGSWVVHANQAGRIAAIVVLAVMGASLIFSGLSSVLTRPAVQLGNKLQGNFNAQPGFAGSAVLGLSTGLLWSPCAGPVLA